MCAGMPCSTPGCIWNDHEHDAALAAIVARWVRYYDVTLPAKGVPVDGDPDSLRHILRDSRALSSPSSGNAPVAPEGRDHE
jgi:hypothetical protein